MRARQLLIAGLVFGMAGGATEAGAQAVELRGRVLDAATGRGVADAVVRVPAAGKYTLTDGTGAFVVTGVGRGLQTVLVAQLGYAESTVQLDVQPGTVHEIALEPRPIALEPLLAEDDRRVRRVLDGAASGRALLMSPNAWAPPVFWQGYDRRAILAAGIDEPIAFLRDGPPRARIRECAGLGLPADRLCVSIPFAGYPPQTWNLSWRPRLEKRLSAPMGFAGPTDPSPSRMRTATVYLDDRPIGPIENLAQYSMSEIYRVETYGAAGEMGIRLYTGGYLRLVSLGVIQPDSRVPFTETYEFRQRREARPGVPPERRRML